VELDIASLEKNILKQTFTLDDITNSRATMDKFKYFMYLKGLATELGIKIEFYSKEYGLASFGKNINQEISGVNIYKTKNNEYIMSLKQAKAPLEQIEPAAMELYSESSFKRKNEFTENQVLKRIKTSTSSSTDYIALEPVTINVAHPVIKYALGQGTTFVQDKQNNLVLFVPVPDFNFPSISFKIADMIVPLQYLNAGLDVANKAIEANPGQHMQTIAECAYIGYLSGGINNYNAYLSLDRLGENIAEGDYFQAFVSSLQLIVSAQISGIIDAYAGVFLSDAFKAAILASSAVYKVNELLSFETGGQIDAACEESEHFLSPL